MRYNDLQYKCKECEYLKPYALDMSGNHGCICKKHQLDYFHKRTDECNEYKIENLETEDVQPVVHSKWEISSDGYYPYCKRCKARPSEMTKYCPECGAKMDGGD